MALAHGGLGMDHMGSMSGMDDSQAGHSAVVSMCLAIVEAVGGSAALLVLGLVSGRGWPRAHERPRFATHSRLLQPPSARARAAPAAMLQVYRL